MVVLQAAQPIDLFAVGPLVNPSQITYYSISSSEIWLGSGEFGTGYDILLMGQKLNTSNAEVTSVRVDYAGSPYLSMTGLSATLAEVEKSLVEGWSSILNSNDNIYGSSGSDRLAGANGADVILGYEGNDFIHGQQGSDYIGGGKGNDLIRGGNGHDTLIGGMGSDAIWGGLGANEIHAGLSSTEVDQIYVTTDSTQNPNGNPANVNVDLIFELDATDRIFMNGTADSTLTFQAGVSDPRGRGYSGIGIFAGQSLEAIVVGSDLTVLQVNNMTIGGFFS